MGFRKKRDCIICVAKTKALISCAVTAQLICGFVFAYAKSRLSQDVAQITVLGNLEKCVKFCDFWCSIKNIKQIPKYSIAELFFKVIHAIKSCVKE